MYNYIIDIQKESETMSTFIRSIGNCYIARFGLDLYENKNGSATIRPTKQGGYNLPSRNWIRFNSLQDAENTIDSIAGEDSSGADRLYKLLVHFGIFRFDTLFY